MMSIEIYTYTNPYRLAKEEFWNDIKDSFIICASQTLVNGLLRVNQKLSFDQITTFTLYLNSLYENWNSETTIISQYAETDNQISFVDLNDCLPSNADPDTVRRSLKRNRRQVTNSLRALFELGMKPDLCQKDSLTIEQKCVVQLYKELYESRDKAFYLNVEDVDNTALDEAINQIRKDLRERYKARYNKSLEKKDLDLGTIVIAGVHQFTPLMLRTIEKFSEHKHVILLFNYIDEYAPAYQTWMNIYSEFNLEIHKPKRNFLENSQDTPGRKLALSITNLLAGKTSAIDIHHGLQITEFDNQTQFANYIADMFSHAENMLNQYREVHSGEPDYVEPSVLSFMKEQIYSANSNVNEILNLYFPDQFRERNFLDYPIGHFFLSVVNMWDPNLGTMNIADMDDVAECLSCGIIKEKYHGQLVSIFHRVELYINNSTTLQEMISKLKDLQNAIDDCEDDQQEKLQKVQYFNVSEDDLQDLIDSLEDLDMIAQGFFDDFDQNNNSFKKFYSKVSDVLITHVLDAKDIDEEFRMVARKLVERLKEVEDVTANASFECLKDTIEDYLQQRPDEGIGAHWIARNFEQIDGDVLNNKTNGVIHFACLSDEDMGYSGTDVFPWPLDVNFFDNIQDTDTIDWKYRVYRTSRMEKKNFKRYAFVYGLLFSKENIHLSYVKHENDKTTDEYYLLKILGISPNIYHEKSNDMHRKNTDSIKLDAERMEEYNAFDLLAYRQCPYRFLISSAVDNGPVFKGDFQISHYLVVLLTNYVCNEYSGKTYNESMVYLELNDKINEIEYDYFPFLSESEKISIVNLAMDSIKNYVHKNRFHSFGRKDKLELKKNEYFIRLESSRNKQFPKISEINQSMIDEELSEDNRAKNSNKPNTNGYCNYCPITSLCLEYYKNLKR